MQATSLVDIKQITTLFDKVSQSKQRGQTDARDILISYLTAANQGNYIEDLDGDNASQVAMEAFASLFNQTEIVTQHYKKQLSSQQVQSARGAKVEATNFDQIKSTTARIVKIQAFFRRLLTMRRLEKQMKSSRQNFNRKTTELPEEAALREFSLQLSTKKLTPEAFFRICDTDYQQRISIATFKDNLTKIGVKLSRGQLSRLIMILDEDMEGTITLEEFYDALEAFGVSGEKHKSQNNSPYHPFEHRALFKLVSELNRNNITYLEMFNACDINDDSRIMISELSKFVEGLSPDFKQKEIHALLNYLDLDKNGIVDKDELLRQLAKAEQIYKQSQIINKNAAQRRSMNLAQAQENNLFDEVHVGTGDQSIFSFVDNMFGKKNPEPVKTAVQSQDKPPVSRGGQAARQEPALDADTLKRKLIIEKMEKEGQNFTSFFSSIKQLSQGGVIALGAILKALEVSYPTIPSVDRNFIIQSCMAQKGKVDYLQLEELFSKFSKNLKPSVSQTFSVIAGNIINRMGGVSATESMRQFFRASNISESGQIGEMEFSELFSGRIAGVTQFDLDQAFRSLDLELDGFISVRDLMDVLISYATGGADKLAVTTKQLVALIPGYDSMSPRTRCEEVIQFVISELSKKNLKPISVFRMADVKNTGGVTLNLLEMTFKKVLPQLVDEVIKESLKGFNAKGARDIVTREDFEIVFREQTTQFIPNSSKANFNTVNNNTTTQPKQVIQQSDEEAMKCIRKLDNAMLRERISPGVAFKHADLNCNGVVSVDELKESFKKLIPGESLSLIDINKVMLAFDKNGNGFIEENEFIALIEEARNSNVTYIESPQKNNNFYQDSSSKPNLPTKNNITLAQNQPSAASDELQSIVQNLEKKVNLRQIFTDLPLNEEGCFVSSNVSRAFKSVQTKDGKGLLPTEYLPLIKSLDSQMRGMFHVKELLKVLEKYSGQTNSDITLELKYMANFVEFQMKARFTKVFMQNNSNLQATGRVMEVEVMAELAKVFGVSMQVGRILYANLQAQKPRGQDVTLDDVCKAIDNFRLVKVEFQADQKLTQSSQINSQQTLIKFVIGLLSQQPRKRELINQKVQQIDQMNKSIPFTDFFELFVTENQLINNVESKALFEYFCSLGKLPKAIQTTLFQQQIQTIQDQIYDCQDKAIGQCMLTQGEAFFTTLSKLKMNDQGYLSKNGFKELLVQFGVVNVKGANPADSQYIQTFKNALKYEFQMTPQLQADEYVESLLRDEIENCKFWTIIEIVARAVQRYDVCSNLILRYLGKLLDLIGQGKDTASILQKLAPQCLNIASGKDLLQMIETLEVEASRVSPGFNHGSIKTHSQKCLEQFYQQATKGVPLRIKDNSPPLIAAINRNRGYVPAQANDNLSASINDRENTSELTIVQKVEKATRMKLEDSVKDFFNQDVVTNVAFAKLLSEQGMTDKPTISQLYQSIDKKKTGRIFIKDLIQYLKDIPGKYNKDQVLKNLVSQVGEPIQRFLEDEGMMANESYSKNDFISTVQSISNLNQFEALCVFYDLAGEEDEILGRQLIQLMTQAKGGAGKQQIQQQDKLLDGSKKAVSFGQDNSFERDQGQIKALCNQFVSNFNTINTSPLIKTALAKFTENIKKYKTLSDAVSRIDPSGKGIITVDQFKKKLDEINGLSNEEKLILCFLPINENKNDIVEINLQKYLRMMLALEVNEVTVNQNSSILNQNVEIIKIYLGVSQPKKNEESKVLGNKGSETMDARKQKIQDMKKKTSQKLKVQLAKIIKSFNKAFSVPKNAELLATQFLQKKDQNLKYGFLTDFIEENFQIVLNQGELEKEWEKLSELMDLDRSGKIQYCDFLEQCDTLEIQFAVKDRSKVIYRQVIMDGPDNYKLTKQDFYKEGVTTILNSEIAALHLAQKLYNEVPNGDDGEFLDQEFGPKYEQSVDDDPNADDPDHRTALQVCCILNYRYFTGDPPKGYIDPSVIKWIRPEAMPRDRGEVPVFIDDGIASSDVIQGKVGNCWFIGALSVIATRDELLRGGNLKKLNPNEDFFEIAEQFSIGVYPPIFHFFRRRGLYVFRFFKEFKWRYVIIDDRIPCMSNNKPVFGSCAQLHELWVPLIEKAYAKIHGCYEALISGFIDDALTDMTGLVAEKIQLQDQNKVFPHKSLIGKEEFWQRLYALSSGEDQSMMGCSAVGDIEGEIQIDGQKCGIISGHAYGIIDLIELRQFGVINPKTGKERIHRLLRIRNPWGYGEWNGKWSDNSEEIELYEDLLNQQYINKLPLDERFHPNQNDGTFLINYQNWREIYANMYICVDFSADWTGIRFDGGWDITCSGGLPSPMTPENMKRWASNPQYLFVAEEEVELFISLAQKDGRGLKNKETGQFMRFPYSELIHPVNFSVLKLPQGKQKLDAFSKDLVVATSVLKEHKEISLRVKLPIGRYVIVPCTRNPGEIGSYTLSLYFKANLKDVEVERIDKPSEEFYLIAEEAEQVDTVEEWKLKMIDEHLRDVLNMSDSVANISMNESFSKVQKSNAAPVVKKQPNKAEYNDDDIY